MSIRIRHIIFCFLLLIPFLGSAQRFYATVNTNQVRMGSNFQLQIILENGKGGELQLPSLEDFYVQGPSRSQNMSWVNGKMSSSVSWTYLLQPKSKGEFTIGKASIKVDGKNLSTEPIVVKVGEGAGGQQNQAQQQNQQKQQQSQQQQPEYGDVGDQVFLKLELDKNTAYVGEQINAVFRLYWRIDVTDLGQTLQQPSFNGFWAQDIEVTQNERTVEVLNGVRYYAQPIRKKALFAQRSGKLEITPWEQEVVHLITYQERMGPWMVPRQKPEKLVVRSPKRTITVKALPEAAPKGFSGAVGKYKLEAAVDKNSAETNDAITLKIKISGHGNVMSIEEPEPAFPPDFEVYDPEIKESISQKSAVVNGSKTYDFLVIPRNPGKFRIKPVTFSYFDPANEAYETLSSEEFELEITGEPSAGFSGGGGMANREDVELLGQDIRYIKTNNSAVRADGGFACVGSGGYYGLLISPYLLAFGLWLVRRKQIAERADQKGFKRKNASRIARKALSEAAKLKSGSDDKAYFEAVALAVWHYLGNRLSVDHGSLSKDNIRELLDAKQIASADTDRLIRLIEDCEMALYAPGAVAGGKEGIYQEAEQIIGSIENQLA